jgi:tRNA (cytidine/uridine-2'-O-)-methyltransferase
MFHIVLYEPEIPQNTGNIMRTAVAIGAKVHLIEPLGFRLEEQKLKRSALDYYEHLDYEVHENYQAFECKNKGTYLFLTRYGQKTHSDIDYQSLKQPIYFIFGKESTGIDKQILAKNLEHCYRIPTTDKVRSLNLSNAVAIVCFEALRQFDYPNLIKEEPETLKGKDFLKQFIEEKPL